MPLTHLWVAVLTHRDDESGTVAELRFHQRRS